MSDRNSPPSRLETSYGVATAKFDGNTLSVSTGTVERVWTLSATGLATTSLRRTDLPSNTPPAWRAEPRNDDLSLNSDWHIPGLVDDTTPGELIQIRGICGKEEDAEVGRDAISRPDCLRVVVVFRYPDPGVYLMYEIDAYPESGGLRTRLGLKLIREVDPVTFPGYLIGGYAERIPARTAGLWWKAVGYYNDTQHRNHPFTPLLKQQWGTIPGDPGARDKPAGPGQSSGRGDPGARDKPAGPGQSSGRGDPGDPGGRSQPSESAGPCARDKPGGRRIHQEHVVQEHGNFPLIVDWANMILFEKDGEGIAIVKESHKCVNQDGVDTGGFVVTEDACLVTGLGLTSNHYGGGFYLNSSEFAMCWASWTLLYQASGEDERQRAVKEFDRIRYPVDPASDLYTMANTWGSRGAGNLSRRAAEEKNVLRELESCADFGIDILQIDDGWEVPLEGGSPSDSQWLPHAERFPEGWGPVRQAAETLGMRLGLWFSWRAPVERILENVEEGGFSALKIDFANCHIREYLDQLVDLAREIVSRAKRDIRINWDLTENSPRMGYFFGREFGNLYLENKQISPEGASRLRHIAYTPSLVLRDAWELAHYCNLNQFQIPIQNTERVRAELSNAWRYPHRYCFAITMAALPIFFQETHLYSEEAREELKPMIALYKEHRERIAEGIVYPLGEYPSDTGFSGFQSHRHRLGDGYITLFRGIDAPDAAKVVRLRFLPSNRLHVEDLANGHTFTLSTDADGRASFEIPDAGDFRFYRYT